LTLSDIQLGILGIIDVESTYNNIILIKFIISQNKVKRGVNVSNHGYSKELLKMLAHRNPS